MDDQDDDETIEHEGDAGEQPTTATPAGPCRWPATGTRPA